MENLIFYFLFFLILFNSLMIILSKNPIHSILFLILVFISTTILLILIGVEFIAMLYLIIYIGAIIVLFLFVIMMLNVKIIQFNERFIFYLPIGFFLGIIFIFEIFYLIINNFYVIKLQKELINFYYINKDLYNNIFYSDYIYSVTVLDNIQNLALILYNKLFFFFLLSGVILLIAMIGSIVLTLNQKLINKKQDIYIQTARSLKDSIRYLKIKK